MNVARAIDRPELIEDDWFETNERRVENADEIDGIIETWTSQRSTEEAIETMEAHDAIVGSVYDIEDIHHDDQYRARDDIVEAEDETFGTLRTPAAIPKFSRTPGTVEHMGVPAGDHNEEVCLEELGLDDEEYERLVADGVI